MEYMVKLIQENTILFLTIFSADILFGLFFCKSLKACNNKRVYEALGARSPGLTLHHRCTSHMEQSMTAISKRFEKGSFYKKARDKMRKAGYKGDYSAILYLCVKYIVSPLVFITACLANYPDFIRPLAAVVLINAVMEMIISSGRRKINLRFQKYIYKIYKYLHNQISSGVKPTDAVRTVYEVIDDRELRGIMVRLAARYELTMDIDNALKEFRSNFDAHEAETLCIALKQGIDTGDNKELLARQEDVMFKKYFNYIQAETDSCRNRCVGAAAVYVAIVVVMIIIPMVSEIGQAVGKIFIN